MELGGLASVLSWLQSTTALTTYPHPLHTQSMTQPTATTSNQDDPPANKSAPDTKPETTSIELNLRLDKNDRTTYDPLLLETSSDAAVGKGDADALATSDEPVV